MHSTCIVVTEIVYLVIIRFPTLTHHLIHNSGVRHIILFTHCFGVGSADMSYIIQNITLEDGGGRGWNLTSVIIPPAFSICPIRSFTAVVASFNVSNRRQIRFIGLHVKASIYKEW
jgi:hypothetical protein